MINYQSEILIFETSGLICPDNNICMYGINQAVFTVLIWGPEKASHTPPAELPHYPGAGGAGEGGGARVAQSHRKTRGSLGFPCRSASISNNQWLSFRVAGEEEGSKEHPAGTVWAEVPPRAPEEIQDRSHTRHVHQAHAHHIHAHTTHIHTCATRATYCIRTPYTWHTHTRTHTHACTHHTTHTHVPTAHTQTHAHTHTLHVCADATHTSHTCTHTTRMHPCLHTHYTRTIHIYIYTYTSRAHATYVPHVPHACTRIACRYRIHTTCVRMHTHRMHVPHTCVCACRTPACIQITCTCCTQTHVHHTCAYTHIHTPHTCTLHTRPPPHMRTTHVYDTCVYNTRAHHTHVYHMHAHTACTPHTHACTHHTLHLLFSPIFSLPLPSLSCCHLLSAPSPRGPAPVGYLTGTRWACGCHSGSKMNGVLLSVHWSGSGESRCGQRRQSPANIKVGPLETPLPP